MGAACSCSDARVISAVTIANGPPDGAEAEPDFREVPRPLAGHLMDEDGVIHGREGVIADQSLAEHLLKYMREHAAAQRVAQVDASTQEVWSYHTLLTEAVQIATALTEEGMGPGDVIAIFSRNYHEMYGAVFGCILAGITVATMVPTHGPAELRHQLLLCEPKAVFVEAGLLPRTEEALEDFPSAVKIFTLQPVPDAGHVTSYQALSERGFIADPDTYEPVPIPDRQMHAAFILYSSGTTGLPKGVQLPNAGLTTMMLNVTGLPDTEAQLDVVTVLVLAPISWISAVILLLKATQLGYRRVAMPEPAPRLVLGSLQTYKVNLWPTAPSVLLVLMNHPARRLFNFSSVKAILCGGGPLSAELQEEASRKLGCAVVQAYGATESGILLTVTVQNNRAGSLGLVEANVDVRLVDLDTNEVVREAGRVGEMRVKNPYIMIGYIRNPEATAACYDEEGWFRTGDLVYVDPDGYFFYVDRLKEMIKYKAHQVAPSEVEAILLTHPGVKDACVMGLPHPVDGEHPMAFVVKSKKGLKEKDLQDFVAERLSEPKHLRGGIIFLETIPRTATGKTQRGELKKMLAQHVRREE